MTFPENRLGLNEPPDFTFSGGGPGVVLVFWMHKSYAVKAPQKRTAKLKHQMSQVYKRYCRCLIFLSWNFDVFSHLISCCSFLGAPSRNETFFACGTLRSSWFKRLLAFTGPGWLMSTLAKVFSSQKKTPF